MNLRLLFALCTTMFLAGCQQDRIAKLEKQNQELAEEVKKSHAVEEYDLQAKCSRDAKAWFKDNWPRDKSTIALIYTNHYNRNDNRCYIRVEENSNLAKQVWSQTVSILDIYENKEYGSIVITHRDYSEALDSIKQSLTCEVHGTKCTSLEEFNALAKPYMTEITGQPKATYRYNPNTGKIEVIP